MKKLVNGRGNFVSRDVAQAGGSPVITYFVDESKDRFGVEVVMFVLVESATLENADSAAAILFQFFLAVVDPFLHGLNPTTLSPAAK